MSTPQQQRGIRITVITLLGFIALLIGWWTYEHYREMPSLEDLNATVLQQPRALKPFQLIDAKGHSFTNQQLQGQWTMLYFGYTHCPDICPTTLATLSQFYNELVKNQQTPPQIVFISVDPARDHPKELQEYTSYFNPHFIGVTGDPKEIKTLTDNIGISYQTAPPAASLKGVDHDTYLVDHSGAVILIDPQGNMHAIFTAPKDPVEMAREFSIIKAAAK